MQQLISTAPRHLWLLICTIFLNDTITNSQYTPVTKIFLADEFSFHIQNNVYILQNMTALGKYSLSRKFLYVAGISTFTEQSQLGYLLLAVSLKPSFQSRSQ